MGSCGIQQFLLAIWTKFLILPYHELVTMPKEISQILQPMSHILLEILC